MPHSLCEPEVADLRSWLKRVCAETKSACRHGDDRRGLRGAGLGRENSSIRNVNAALES